MAYDEHSVLVTLEGSIDDVEVQHQIVLCLQAANSSARVQLIKYDEQDNTLVVERANYIALIDGNRLKLVRLFDHDRRTHEDRRHSVRTADRRQERHARYFDIAPLLEPGTSSNNSPADP